MDPCKPGSGARHDRLLPRALHGRVTIQDGVQENAICPHLQLIRHLLFCFL